MAPIVDGMAVNASNENAQKLDKVSDDTALGVITLANAGTASGTSVSNLQREQNAIWSFLGGLINQAKTYVPTWSANSQAAQTFGTSSDTIKAKIQAIIDAFDPSTGSQAVRAGSASISNGSATVSVTFSVALPNANYSVCAFVENTTDATPIFLQGVITSKSPSGFTFTANAPTDTANYKLNYIVRNYA